MHEGWFQVVLEVFSEQFDLLHYVTSELFHFLIWFSWKVFWVKGTIWVMERFTTSVDMSDNCLRTFNMDLNCVLLLAMSGCLLRNIVRLSALFISQTRKLQALHTLHCML